MSLATKPVCMDDSANPVIAQVLPRGVLARLILTNEKEIVNTKGTFGQPLPKYQISVETAKKLGIEVIEPITLTLGWRYLTDQERNGRITERMRYFDITNNIKDDIIEILKSAEKVKAHFDRYFEFDKRLSKFGNKPCIDETKKENLEYVKARRKSAYQKAFEHNQAYQVLQSNRGIVNVNCIYSLSAPSSE